MSIEKEIIKLIEENDNVLDINLFNTAYVAGISLYSVLIDSIRIASNDNEIYAIFAAEDKPLILQFKDVESIEIVLKCNRELPLPEYNLDYNTEEEIIVDGHVLKIVYLFNLPFSKLNDAFIIDAETRKALVTVDNKNGNYINYALADILGTQKYIDKDWYSVNKHPDYEVPELLTPVITKCQLLIDFSMR